MNYQERSIGERNRKLPQQLVFGDQYSDKILKEDLNPIEVKQINIYI